MTSVHILESHVHLLYLIVWHIMSIGSHLLKSITHSTETWRVKNKFENSICEKKVRTLCFTLRGSKIGFNLSCGWGQWRWLMWLSSLILLFPRSGMTSKVGIGLCFLHSFSAWQSLSFVNSTRNLRRKQLTQQDSWGLKLIKNLKPLSPDFWIYHLL